MYTKKIDKKSYLYIFTRFILLVVEVVLINLISSYISFIIRFKTEAINAILQTNNNEAVESFLEFIFIKAILFFLSLLLFYISIWHKKMT